MDPSLNARGSLEQSTVFFSNKRRERSTSEDVEHDDGERSRGTLHHRITNGCEDDVGVYGASHFGRWDEYMRRKRAKLQIQNASLDKDEGGIFKGLSIYINGWTRPSVQELRQLIVKHGGVFQPYLDKKSLVTHIVTCSLTAAKVREFKHMKVVRPEWLVDSVTAGVLKSWKDYLFRPGDRVEPSTQGSRIGQTRLMADSKPPPPPPPPSGDTGRQRPSPVDRQPDVVPTESESESGAVGSDAVTRPVFDDIRSPPAHDSPRRSIQTTDSISHEEAVVRVPGYAAGTTNEMAQRVMADPRWRTGHTAIAPDFIQEFYKNSRLHHLSMWKAELKDLVILAHERAEKKDSDDDGGRDGSLVEVNEREEDDDDAHTVPSNDVSMRGAEMIMRSPRQDKGKRKAEEHEHERVVMHCDFDCFFVSAGLTTRPHLRGRPVVVCHSQGNQGGASSTSEIASASYEARSFGIKNGMSLRQAKRLCPLVLTIPYEFERYKNVSLQFYTILMRHADDLQAVSVDEALIDVSLVVASRKAAAPFSSEDHAITLAEHIRAEVKAATGCDVSIGIASNIQLARLATRKAKPVGLFHLKSEDVSKVLEPLDIDDLHGFGHSTRQKAEERLGTAELGELAKKTKAQLCEALGKGTGETLYKAIRGIDDRKLESDKPRKSVSCDINYGVRFENTEQAKTFVYRLAEEVARRLDDISTRGRSLTLKIMKRDPSAAKEAPKFMGHGICDTFNKQTVLTDVHGQATSDSTDIGDHAWRLLKTFDFDPTELRGIGIQVQRLEKVDGENSPLQARLPFQPLERGKTPECEAEPRDDVTQQPDIVIQPSSRVKEIPIRDLDTAGGTTATEVPPFSQVDMEVFGALPEDIRKELEEEYSRRLSSPVSKPAAHRAEHQPKMVVKGCNVKRITQQLAPRSRASISPKKSTLFSKREIPSSIPVSEDELRELGIDPEVFAVLPVDMQREQLIAARHLKNGGILTEPKVIKDTTTKTRTGYRQKPPPQAKHPQQPFLKQQGPQKGERLYFSETADLQRVIEAWVEGFRERPPNLKDVEYFSKFLVQSSEASDTGMEKTIAVMKWWLVLLRRHWGIYEHADGSTTGDATQRVTSQAIARAWWEAFREIKYRVDEIVTKRFGGPLSLK